MHTETNATTFPDLPQYGTKPDKPGLYLGLFHGRSSPTEQMDEWGFNGPLIGPLDWCHTTYATDINISFVNPEDSVKYAMDDEFTLKVSGDLLVFGGYYYGDWTVYYVAPQDCMRPDDTFRPNARLNDKTAHCKIFPLFQNK